MTKQQAKRKCEKIAREYGANLTWMDDVKGFGFYRPGTNKINVGSKGSVRSLITIFCHELGHYDNHLNGKYYKYHHLTGKRLLKRFKTKKAIARYALNAEVYTDKVGKRLCKKYFPDITYKGSYKFNKAQLNMMYQKYFGGFVIIFLQRNLI